MAECIFREMLRKSGAAAQFAVGSAAISAEEIGCPIYHEARTKLTEAGIPLCAHRAVQLKKSDYDQYDLILGMERSNIQSILRITGGDPAGKVRRLLDFSGHPHDIADPWYTGDFDAAYNDIAEGCKALLDALAPNPNHASRGSRPHAPQPRPYPVPAEKP